MPESMDPELTVKLNAMCDAYAGRKKLHADDRQELFDHLEDALQGYLTGQTRVTPEDALLLARARLGDVKGVVAQLQPERAWGAWGTHVKVAIVTGILTIFVLPIAMLVAAPPAGRPSDFARVVLLLPLTFLTIEGGVFLTARADMRSRWQRLVAFALSLPAILIFCLILMNAGHTFKTPAFGSLGSEALRALSIACLGGHAALAFMLITPRKSEPTLAGQ